MKIIILFDGRWNPLNVSLSTRILILSSIGGQNIMDSHWFLKDKKAMDWKEGFSQLPWDKENKFKEGSWKAGGRGVFGGLLLVWFFWEGEEKDEKSW
jgi:hypothetical protein